MRFAISALIALSALLSPMMAFAQSADIEGTIADLSTEKSEIKLDDGEVYKTPSEFNFDGLEKGVRVTVFYTIVDGRRVINDLELLN